MIDFDYVYKTGPNAHKTVKQMFTQNISIDVEDCHFWQGKQFPNGYGCFRSRGNDMLAHRVAFELFNGKPPTGVVMHTCDNRLCVNPEHLVDGTHKLNMRDCVEKGRMGKSSGNRHWATKVPDEVVIELNRLRSEGMNTVELSKMFNLTQKYVSRVTNGERRGAAIMREKMTPSNYIKLAMRTNKDMGFEGNLIHAAMLAGSEAGELISEIKRNFAYGKHIDRSRIIDEAGDVLWMVALLCHTLEVPMEEMMTANILKLEKRYPDLCFNADHAVQQRDKQG